MNQIYGNILQFGKAENYPYWCSYISAKAIGNVHSACDSSTQNDSDPSQVCVDESASAHSVSASLDASDFDTLESTSGSNLDSKSYIPVKSANDSCDLASNTLNSASNPEHIVNDSTSSPGYNLHSNLGHSPGHDPGSNPGHNPGPNPGHNPGHHPGSNAKHNPSNPGHNPGSNPGHNPDPNPGHNPGSNPGHNPDHNPAHNPNSNPGHNPGSNRKHNPTNPGHNPGSNPGHNPDSNPGHNPSYPGHNPGQDSKKAQGPKRPTKQGGGMVSAISGFMNRPQGFRDFSFCAQHRFAGTSDLFKFYLCKPSGHQK